MYYAQVKGLLFTVMIAKWQSNTYENALHMSKILQIGTLNWFLFASFILAK